MLGKLVTNHKSGGGDKNDNQSTPRQRRELARFFKLVDYGELYAACEYGHKKKLKPDVIMPIAEILCEAWIDEGKYSEAEHYGVKYGVNTELLKRAQILNLRETANMKERAASELIETVKSLRETAAKIDGTWKPPERIAQPSAEEFEIRRRENLEERTKEGLRKFDEAIAGGNLLGAQHIVKTDLSHKPDLMRKVHMLMLDEAIRSGDENEVRLVMKVYHLTEQDREKIKSFLESEKELVQRYKSSGNNNNA